MREKRKKQLISFFLDTLFRVYLFFKHVFKLVIRELPKYFAYLLKEEEKIITPERKRRVKNQLLSLSIEVAFRVYVFLNKHLLVFIRLFYYELLYRAHLRLRFVHDNLYLTNKSYKQVVDYKYTRSIKRATALAAVFSFLVIQLLSSALPDVFNTPGASAGNTSITWTNKGHFDGSSLPTGAISNSLSVSSITLSGDNNDSTDSNQNDTASLNYEKFPAVYNGYRHSLLLKNDGVLKAAGYNNWTQLGVSGGDKNYWAQTLTDVKSAAACSMTSFAIKNDGSLWGTGYNFGNGWVQTLNDVKKVACSKQYTGIFLALKTDGTVWARGSNDSGMLGLGGVHPNSTWVQTSSDAKDIALGSNTGYILKNDLTLHASGANADLQYGIITAAVNNWTPILADVVKVSAGEKHVLAIKSDNTLWGAGYNNYNQLGLTNLTDKVWTQLLTDVVDMSAGSLASVALRSGNVLWGAGISGQRFGLGHTNRVTNWTIVMTDVIQAETGADETIISTSNGNVYATGYNLYGGLGFSGSNTNVWTYTSNNAKNPFIYYSPGSLSGYKVDAGVGLKAQWSTATYNAVTPANTSITFETRGSDDNSNWTGWQALTPEGNVQTGPSRYLEIKVTLATSDGENTPTLNDFTVNYNTLDNISANSLKMYKNDGSTLITANGFTNEGTVKVKAENISGVQSGDNVFLDVDVETDNTFDDNGIVSSDAVAYNGSPITLEKAITGLSDQTQYYVRARLRDSAGRQTAWTIYNSSNVAFSVDQTSPTGTISINSDAQYTTTGNVTLHIRHNHSTRLPRLILKQEKFHKRNLHYHCR